MPNSTLGKTDSNQYQNTASMLQWQFSSVSQSFSLYEALMYAKDPSSVKSSAPGQPLPRPGAPGYILASLLHRHCCNQPEHVSNFSFLLTSVQPRLKPHGPPRAPVISSPYLKDDACLRLLCLTIQSKASTAFCVAAVSSAVK